MNLLFRPISLSILGGQKPIDPTSRPKPDPIQLELVGLYRGRGWGRVLKHEP